MRLHASFIRTSVFPLLSPTSHLLPLLPHPLPTSSRKMRFNFSLLLAALPLVSSRSIVDKRQTSIDAWITAQEPISRTGIFRNIGGGEYAKDVDRGAVIASPSKANPDYFYQWTRDTGLVSKFLLNLYLNGNTSLEAYLQDYTAETYKLQHTNNPSGGYTSGGIGEPKFHVNGAPYTGGWGRPQTDGPAIRATVLIKYANELLDRNTAAATAYVKEKLYDGILPTNTVIKADLEYVSHYWENGSGFDLWEEVQGIHFFNVMVQRRALVEGAELATRLGDTGAATWYNQQAAALNTRIPQFWNASKGFLVATLNHGRSGQDCGTLLGALHGTGKRGFGNYTPGSDQILATLHALVEVMRPLYPVNSQAGYPGVAIGRYPSDVYDVSFSVSPNSAL